MIRKVPNLNMWILRFKDIQTLLHTNKSINNGGLIELPLFSNTSVVIPIKFCWQFNYILIWKFDGTLIENDQERIVLVVDHIIDRLINFTLDEIDMINKIWNEFYVSEDKL